MNQKQKHRYSRHLMLNEIGEKGQQKLLLAKVLVVGAGGLGCPTIQYLAAAGVGKIGIIDPDVVSLSNLQRQIIFNNTQIGKLKAEEAKHFIEKLNPDIQVTIYPNNLNTENALQIIHDYDMVIGATDNFESRLCINNETKRLGIPFVHGSICEFEGQVSVFNYKNGPSYTDLFNEIPNEKNMPLGVIGVLPGVIGSLMATEAIKIIIEHGNVLSGRLLIYNALEASFNEINFN